MSQREPLNKMEYLGCQTIYCNVICCDWNFGRMSTSRVERARDAFRRCVALRSPKRQHQPQSPVEGLTSRTLLWECKGVPTRSLPHSLCTYKTLVCENEQRRNSKLLRRISMVRYWILRQKSLPVQFKQASWSKSRKGKIKQVKRNILALDERNKLKSPIPQIMDEARHK